MQHIESLTTSNKQIYTESIYYTDHLRGAEKLF